MSEALLEVKDLTVDFRGKKALRGVNFSVYPGEILSLVGESGSGKTITALAIMDLLPLSASRPSGRVYFKGKDVYGLSREEIRNMRGNNIGMVFQEPFTALNPVIRIGDQISETIAAHTDLPAEDIAGKVKELLSTVKLSPDAASLYPHELSGGMRQRAMLAMALSCDPDILMLDEPTTALDVSIQKHILDLIKSIQRERGLTILFITHDFSVVNAVADRVCVMNQGKVVECGHKREVLHSPRHEYTKKLIDSIPRLGDKRERLPV
ncbi:MAG: ABC transporter ATP-binding protein [Candidatus Omnitrophota bacterium]|jgi:ABC-type glutathione transport system ATPase component